MTSHLRTGETFEHCGHRAIEYDYDNQYRCGAPATRWFRRAKDDCVAARCDIHPPPTSPDDPVEPSQEISRREAEVMLILRS